MSIEYNVLSTIQLENLEFGSFKNCMSVSIMRVTDKIESFPCVPREFIEFMIYHGSQSLHYNLQEEEAQMLINMLEKSMGF